MHFATATSERTEGRAAPDAWITGRRAAWFAFAMTFLLMLLDYVDRQVIVSLFPYLKAEWALSDKQLGGLVSVISLVVAVGSIPVALVADRSSRVLSVMVMAGTWSLACMSCMFARGYAQLFAARALVGAGEAGYGSVGAALIASVFPARLRSGLMGAFFAAASLGSVLGVLLGGFIAARWGWAAAFGAVGAPGLVLALLYVFVKDYRTVALDARLEPVARSPGAFVRHVAGRLWRIPTLLWICVGAPLQLVVVAAVWSWLPSFLNRVHGLPAEAASRQGALVVLAGALGSIVWGTVVDRIAARRLRAKLVAVAGLCAATTAIFLAAFGLVSDPVLQFRLILLGGFVMTCSVGPIAAVALDVVHPGLRSTGAAVLSLAQNLLGLAVGPVLAGALSDRLGLQPALAVVSLSGLAAAAAFLWAARSYERDALEASAVAPQGAAPSGPAGAPAPCAS